MADNGGPEIGNKEPAVETEVKVEDVKAEPVKRRGRARKTTGSESGAAELDPDTVTELPAVPSIADKVKKGRRASAAASDAIKKQSNPKQKRQSTEGDEKPVVKEEAKSEPTPGRGRGRRAKKEESPPPRPTRGRVKAEAEATPQPAAKRGAKKAEPASEDTGRRGQRKRGRQAAARSEPESEEDDKADVTKTDVTKRARKPTRRGRAAKSEPEQDEEEELRPGLARRRKTDDEETDEAEELDDGDDEAGEADKAGETEPEVITTSRAGRARKPIHKYEPEVETLPREKGTKKGGKKGDDLAPRRKGKASPQKRRKDDCNPSIDDELAAMQRGMSGEEVEEEQRILHAGEDDLDTDSYVEDDLDEEPTTSDGRGSRRGKGRPPVRFEDEPEDPGPPRKGRARKKIVPASPPEFYDDMGGPPPLEGDPGVGDLGLDLGQLIPPKSTPGRRGQRRKPSDDLRMHSPLGNGAYGGLENGLPYEMGGEEFVGVSPSHIPKKRGRKPKTKGVAEPAAHAQEAAEEEEKEELSVSMRGRARKPVKRNDMVYFGDKDRERKIQAEAAKMKDTPQAGRRGRKPKGRMGGVGGPREAMAAPSAHMDPHQLLGEDISLPFEEIQSILARETGGPGPLVKPPGACAAAEEEDVEIPPARGRDLVIQQDTKFYTAPRPPALDDHTYYSAQIPASVIERVRRPPPVSPPRARLTPASTTRSIGQIGALSPTNTRKLVPLGLQGVQGLASPGQVKYLVRASPAIASSALAAHLTGQVAASESGNSGTALAEPTRTALSQAELL